MSGTGIRVDALSRIIKSGNVIEALEKVASFTRMVKGHLESVIAAQELLKKVENGIIKL